MKIIALTQRVDIIAAYGERRDALDQNWSDLLLQAGLLPLLVPNRPDWLAAWLRQQRIDGLLLTGGNSLQSCGGDAPERDQAETHLLDYAIQHQLPVLGVCRGMQLLMQRAGAKLQPVTGHVAARQEIEINSQPVAINSYHDWGTTEVPAEYTSWAKADDGMIKAIRHRQDPVWGIMWHPERFAPFRPDDINLLQQVFDSNEDNR